MTSRPSISKFERRNLSDYDGYQHGDYDIATLRSTARLEEMLGFAPYAYLCGHRHTSTFAGGIRMVGGGSLCGTGDDFTIESRYAGAPSQIALLCSAKGIECIVPVEFAK